MIIPEYRNMQFDFSNIDFTNWTQHGRAATNSANALSLIFPEFEKQLIYVAREIRKTLPEGELKQATDAFIYQEARHSRWHIEFNKKLTELGLPVKEVADLVEFCSGILRKLPIEEQATINACFEHWTAAFANLVKGENIYTSNSDPEIKRFWEWHGIEEDEHKSVCFDLMTHVCGNSLSQYLKRTFWFCYTGPVFYIVYMIVFTAIMQKTKDNGIPVNSTKMLRDNRKSYLGYIKHWTKFLKRDFHPSKY